MVGGFCGSFKVSPYAADRNLLPHLKHPELELDAVSPLGKHINASQASLSKAQKQLHTHPAEKVQHTDPV